MELPAEVPTLDGHTIKIDKTTDGDVLIAGNKVVAPDIEASNGVIHGSTASSPRRRRSRRSESIRAGRTSATTKNLDWTTMNHEARRRTRR